jgi:hypothetical protein
MAKLKTTCQHYWRIHKHVFDEELERMSNRIRQAVQLQIAEPDMFDNPEYRALVARVERRTQDIFLDESHPYNQRFTFEADTQADKWVGTQPYAQTQ